MVLDNSLFMFVSYFIMHFSSRTVIMFLFFHYLSSCSWSPTVCHHVSGLPLSAIMFLVFHSAIYSAVVSSEHSSRTSMTIEAFPYYYSLSSSLTCFLNHLLCICVFDTLFLDLIDSQCLCWVLVNCTHFWVSITVLILMMPNLFRSRWSPNFQSHIRLVTWLFFCFSDWSLTIL